MARRTTKRLSYDIAAQAAHLLQRGLSAPIVAVETGINELQAKRLRAKLGLGTARRGVMRETASLVLNDHSMIEVALFANIYRKLGGEAILRAVQLDALVRAHVQYLSLRQFVGLPTQRAIDINQAWVLARDARSGVLLWRRCADKRCGSAYVLAKLISREPPQSICPVCRMEERQALSRSAAVTRFRIGQTTASGLSRRTELGQGVGHG